MLKGVHQLWHMPVFRFCVVTGVTCGARNAQSFRNTWFHSLFGSSWFPVHFIHPLPIHQDWDYVYGLMIMYCLPVVVCFVSELILVCYFLEFTPTKQYTSSVCVVPTHGACTTRSIVSTTWPDHTPQSLFPITIAIMTLQYHTLYKKNQSLIYTKTTESRISGEQSRYLHTVCGG